MQPDSEDEVLTHRSSHSMDLQPNIPMSIDVGSPCGFT